jgi:hypothetical protein
MSDMYKALTRIEWHDPNLDHTGFDHERHSKIVEQVQLNLTDGREYGNEVETVRHWKDIETATNWIKFVQDLADQYDKKVISSSVETIENPSDSYTALSRVQWEPADLTLNMLYEYERHSLLVIEIDAGNTDGKFYDPAADGIGFRYWKDMEVANLWIGKMQDLADKYNKKIISAVAESLA